MDAVLFYEALHHLADEAVGLKKVHDVLKPGGVVGITGEGNWQPGNVVQEGLLAEEMERFGTLESPFTFEYLEFSLRKAGFRGITRYHGVNGFYPIEAEDAPIKEVADYQPGSATTSRLNAPQLLIERYRWHSIADR